MNEKKDDKMLPQEFHFEDTADSVRVKTTVGKDTINHDTLLRHVRHFRLGAGTIIKVQVMSKDYDVLLHSADFVIERAVEVTRQIVDERGERTATITDYKVVQDSEWKSYSEAPEPVSETPVREPERYVPSEAEIKHAGGRNGAWNVMVGDEIWAVIERVESETKEDHRARALAIASGSKPLPSNYHPVSTAEEKAA